MLDSLKGLKVMDYIVVLKYLDAASRIIAQQTPDSDEMLFYGDTDGIITTKAGSAYHSFKGAGRQISETTTARTLALSDAFEFISCSHASGTAITISGAISWPQGVEFFVHRPTGAGALSVSGTNGATILNSAIAADVEELGTLGIKEISANTFLLI